MVGWWWFVGEFVGCWGFVVSLLVAWLIVRVLGFLAAWLVGGGLFVGLLVVGVGCQFAWLILY